MKSNMPKSPADTNQRSCAGLCELKMRPVHCPMPLFGSIFWNTWFIYPLITYFSKYVYFGQCLEIGIAW